MTDEHRPIEENLWAAGIGFTIVQTSKCKGETVMNIVPITNENRSGFLPLIPHELCHGQEVLLGAVDDSTGCGLAAYEILEDRCVINWLWVAGEWRGEGVASALLDAACTDAFSKREHVQLCYSASLDGCGMLDLMLMRRGFLVTVKDVLRCELTGEQLLNSPLMKKAKPNKNKWSRILPLYKVEPRALRACMVVNEENEAYQASRADFAGADIQRSMALMVDTEVKGCLLIHPDGEPGCLRVSMFFLDASCSNLGVAFLRACVERCMEFPEGIKSLRILAASRHTKKMVTTLLGDVTYQKERVHDAQGYRQKPMSDR